LRAAATIACAFALASPSTSVAASVHLGDRPLRNGAQGHDVRVLQDMLTRSGFATPVDGEFGDQTKTSVRAFQRAAQLTASGTVGPITVKTLRSAAASAASVAPWTGGVAASPPPPPPAPGAVGPDGMAAAPAGAPPAVQAMVAAGNAIATKPYRYGGGHGDWEDDAYDCSGSVSYALHGAALVDGPLDSSGLARWGRSGPGQWVTIYANAKHVYMVVAGMRFDTVGQKATGSRWQAATRSSEGFTVRHPPGL
jgi:peptidoglycan hydrolase-like protein with peptidoglycan-binding domain